MTAPRFAGRHSETCHRARLAVLECPLTNPTLAAGDVKVSKDGGAYTNIATLPTTYPTGSNTIIVSLSATEMEAEVVVVRFTDQTKGGPTR